MEINCSIPFSNLNGDLQILIVDDDPIIRLLHKRIVESIVPGLPVVTCKNGAEAIDFIQSTHACKFLVLLDINMPVMNGWEFLQQCQEKQISNISVVIVSSSINHPDRSIAATFPQVFRYCEKPLNKEIFTELTLQKEIKQLFHTYLTENNESEQLLLN